MGTMGRYRPHTYYGTIFGEAIRRALPNFTLLCYHENMKIKKELQFNVMFRPEPEGGFTAIVPSLPGCITYGKDLREAKELVIDAIRGYIASVKKHNGAISHDAGSFMSSIQFPANTAKQNA